MWHALLTILQQVQCVQALREDEHLFVLAESRGQQEQRQQQLAAVLHAAGLVATGRRQHVAVPRRAICRSCCCCRRSCGRGRPVAFLLLLARGCVIEVTVINEAVIIAGIAVRVDDSGRGLQARGMVPCHRPKQSTKSATEAIATLATAAPLAALCCAPPVSRVH